MPEVTRELLTRLPKAELHVHLDGSLRPQTMIDLARSGGIALPHDDAESLGRFMHVDETTDLPGYLERFGISLSVMQTYEGLERIAYELAEDAAKENVRWIEVRFCPALNIDGGLTLEQALEAPLAGLARARADFGILSGVIVCALRSRHPRESLQLAELAVQYMDRGVVAFDLAGAEKGYPASDHAEAFDLAAAKNLPITIHAGEGYGPESINQALHRCHARRIGHGTRLGEDPALFAYVRDFRIPLEVCPTSNVQTGAARSLATHPIRDYYDRGVVVTVSTDNRLMSGVSLTDEYVALNQHLRFTWDELVDVSRMAFQSAFLPWPEKLELLERVDAEISGM
jgi:adenosine deaminase